LTYISTGMFQKITKMSKNIKSDPNLFEVEYERKVSQKLSFDKKSY